MALNGLFEQAPYTSAIRWKADVPLGLTNVRFWGQSGTLTNRCLPISIYEFTALVYAPRRMGVTLPSMATGVRQ
jgi:hypothetical protein